MKEAPFFLVKTKDFTSYFQDYSYCLRAISTSRKYILLMISEMQIHLQKVKFFGCHGLDAGEEITGGEFEVNLTTNYIPVRIPIKKIEETLDYTALLSIVRERMNRPADLLETLATEIATEIIAKFSIVTAVEISISKLHPPIQNFEGSVGVTFKIKEIK